MKTSKVKNEYKIYVAIIVLLGLTVFYIPSVFAADDPITVVNNLSDFIFGITRAVGMIITGYAIVQIGLSFSTHDPSQRANGILFAVGGLIITFAKEILNTIAG